MKKVVFVSSILLCPLLVFAAQINLSYFTNGINAISSLLKLLAGVLGSLAVIYFIWNVIKYTMSSGADDKKEAAGKIIWSLIGVVVIVSIWGFVGIIQKIFGVQDQTSSTTNTIGGQQHIAP